MVNVAKIKNDFPILQRQINGHPLVYLDNAATTQKPQQVVDALADYYGQHNANIHRGVHTLAEEATAMYEAAREKVRLFVNAESTQEIVFVRNATEAINLVAYSWGHANISEGDEILLTEMEHHANLLPWQRLAAQRKAKLRFLPITTSGELDWQQLPDLLTDRTKLVGLTAMSNLLGTINDIERVVQLAHNRGAVVMVDAAQSIPHMTVDVQKSEADFVAFSGHKMFGPTGIGVLYGKKSILETMSPFLTGGEMIRHVSYDSATWHDLPWKFEAGTPNIAGAIGLGVAIDYLQIIGMSEVRRHEQRITAYALEKLNQVAGLTLYGPTNVSIRGGIMTFNLDGIHAHDVASALDERGIAIRSGHHCAEPLTKKLGVSATCRASFYIYNDESDVDMLVENLQKTAMLFRRS
jgi:cysteine desulfurase/selenocysteine lyase